MKKQKTLAVLLSAAMVAGAIPTAALAEVVGSNSDSGVKAAELSEDQEIAEQNEDSEDETGPRYVLMNVPYDEVYGKDIANKTKVDAVSSATKKKNEKKDFSKWHLSFKRWKRDQRSDHSGTGRGFVSFRWI